MKTKTGRNRAVLAAMSIILAAGICFGIPVITDSAATSAVEIVILNSNVEQGQKIEESMLSKIMVGKLNLPADTVYDYEDVTGKYANEKLYAGDFLRACKFDSSLTVSDEILGNLPPDKWAVSVTLKNSTSGLSGKLKSGDIVTVFHIGDGGELVQSELLKYVKVISATQSKGTNTDKSNENLIAVTLLADENQAAELAACELKSQIHLALAFRGTEEQAELYLQSQQKLIEEKGGE